MHAKPIAVAIILISACSAAANADIKEDGFSCPANSEDCTGTITKHSTGAFNYAVVNGSRNGPYTIDKAWFRGRLAGKTSWTNFAIRKKDIDNYGDKGVVFSFDVADAARKLGTDEATLKKGFEFQAKTDPLGVGGGRQDKCPTVYAEFSDTDNMWAAKFNKEGGDLVAQDPVIFAVKAKGSVNDVQCKTMKELN